MPKKKKNPRVTRDPQVLWEGPIAEKEVDHATSLPHHDRHWITHYLCCLHELDKKNSKKSGLTFVRRRWYLTIDGTSRKFIPEHEALTWLLSKSTREETRPKIINQYECDLLRTINLG